MEPRSVHAWEQIYLPRLIGPRLLWSPGGTGPMFLRRQVVTVHDMMQLDHPGYFSRDFAQWYGFLLPRVIHISRKVLTMSEYAKSRICIICRRRRERSGLLRWALQSFRPYRAGEIAAARHRVAIPAARYFLSVASVVSHKNLRRVLEAREEVGGHAPDTCLVLVGCGADSRGSDGAGLCLAQ